MVLNLGSNSFACPFAKKRISPVKILVLKTGQKEREKQILDLPSVCNPLKKRGVPLRIYEMVRWEDTLLGLVQKKKCASII